MRRLLLLVFCAGSITAFSQYKSYIIGVKGDTLNRVDMNDQKQGPWVVKVPPARGEAGYEEEGYFKNNEKNGTWRTYSAVGDLMAIENYRFGNKHGQCSYYTIFGIVRQESWKAIDPENPYDTVDVPELNGDKVYRRVVKIEASTVKHGTWTYYNPETGLIQKTEEYILDKLVTSKKKSYAFADSTQTASVDTTKSLAKPREVMEYEKKNKKKKIKVRDGDTGIP